MTASAPPTLVELARWASEPDIAEVVDELGLRMTNRVEHGGYHSTPTNSVMFASTGGDGVHFSLVDLGDGVTDSSPVVMTVPMQFDDPNWVVGENLVEFLALGLTGGFFALEGLAYGASLTGDHLEPAQRRVLDDLAKQFSLRPWADVDARLRALGAQFGDRLIFST